MVEKIDLDPQTLNIEFYAGDGVNFKLTVKDSENEPIDLTGEFLAQIRLERTSEDPSAEFDVDSSKAEEGTIILSLTGEQTAALVTSEKFKGVWDVQWTPEGGQPKTLFQGRVRCTLDVSR